jgi:hypothetical protein
MVLLVTTVPAIMALLVTMALIMALPLRSQVTPAKAVVAGAEVRGMVVVATVGTALPWLKPPLTAPNITLI